MTNTIYLTWDSFRESLYDRLRYKGLTLSAKEWAFLKDELYFGALHPPYDAADMEDAVGRAKEIRKFNETT